MTFGDFARTPLQKLAMMLAAFSMIAAPALATAQDAVVEEAVVETATAPATEAAPADEAAAAAEAPAFEHFGADMIKGQPEAGGIDFQPQFTADGQFAHDMHNYLLMPIITFISLFVLGMLHTLEHRLNLGGEKGRSTGEEWSTAARPKQGSAEARRERSYPAADPIADPAKDWY